MEIRRDNPLNWVILFFIIIILVLAIYFTWFYWPTCENNECYIAHQEKCGRVRYAYETEDKIWNFRTLGREDGNCEIEVILSKIKKGDVTLKSLEGKKMLCTLPLGTSESPEANLGRCTGRLKEEIQEQIIKRLHLYIVDNVNEVKEGLSTF
jgi:hypothetical protein